MKTKERLAKQYIGERDVENYSEVELNSYNDFIAGYEAGQPKWISVENNLPNDDRIVLIYVRNLETPHWSKLEIGSYIDGKWYLRGGTSNNYEIVRWMEIPYHGDEEKSLNEWNSIFGKNIKTGKEFMTEKEYIMETVKLL